MVLGAKETILMIIDEITTAVNDGVNSEMLLSWVITLRAIVNKLDYLRAENETLRDALESIRDAFFKGEIATTKKRQSDSDPHHPAIVKMWAALDKEREDNKND